ncbi:sensor histidine kinase [Actinoplanes sp. NPDC048988]|uniref:sensor histidine kinase n=1 Tax=Actinoplanes sp. NPDC048988 TaxID=3363901 RepID=UPI0037239BDE
MSPRRVMFCVAGVISAAVILAVPAILPGTAVLILWATGTLAEQPAPVVAPVFLILFPLTVALLVLTATPFGRTTGNLHRLLARRLLGEHVDAPPPRRTRGISDGPGWRALGYGVLKVPLAVPEGYGAFCYVFGIVNLSYPVWWPLFRNHPPGTTLGTVYALTPFGTIGTRTFAGTFLIAAAGLAMLLAAPWLMRAGVALDLAAMRRLLGPGRLAELRVSRARAIDDAAAMMRRIERDLHDGAQIRLATLAMNLGMASEKLGADGPPPDLAQARELVALAHGEAKQALADLRDLVRGIHPPVLDNGLGDALATLVTSSPLPVALPVTVTVELPVRPAPAIETIAYFCAAELLANAAKHSRAAHVALGVAGTRHRLTLTVEDDGAGGADPDGPGLSGLTRRIAVVDGRMRVDSPPGGPTRIEIELPTQV